MSEAATIAMLAAFCVVAAGGTALLARFGWWKTFAAVPVLTIAVTGALLFAMVRDHPAVEAAIWPVIGVSLISCIVGYVIGAPLGMIWRWVARRVTPAGNG